MLGDLGLTKPRTSNIFFCGNHFRFDFYFQNLIVLCQVARNLENFFTKFFFLNMMADGWGLKTIKKII